MEKRKPKFARKLRNRYRMVILDDETFEEKASFRLTRFNVYLFLSSIFVLVVMLIFAIIVYTPLKEYIPGYGDLDLRKNVLSLEMRSDSLNMVVRQQATWINNISNVLRGNVDTTALESTRPVQHYDTIDLEQIPEADLRLREEIEKEQSFSLSFSRHDAPAKVALSQLNFFPPIKGYITAHYNPKEDHFGIDVVAAEDEPVKNILDGNVILSTWTLETGYVIAIQHEYNLISFYKHNSVLLKKTGNFVRAGDAVAIVGSSGELSTGPHLHFELWHDGSPVNPEEFIVF